MTSTFFWVVFWISITALAIIPNAISQGIADLLGFKSNVNAIIFVALGFLFSIVFYLSAAVERLERQMTDLIRKVAIENASKHEEKAELLKAAREKNENIAKQS